MFIDHFFNIIFILIFCKVTRIVSLVSKKHAQGTLPRIPGSKSMFLKTSIWLESRISGRGDVSWILVIIGFGGSGGASGRPDFAPNPEPNGGFQKYGLSRIPRFEEKH